MIFNYSYHYFNGYGIIIILINGFFKYYEGNSIPNFPKKNKI